MTGSAVDLGGLTSQRRHDERRRRASLAANTAYTLSLGTATVGSNTMISVANNGSGAGAVSLGALTGNSSSGFHLAGGGLLALTADSPNFLGAATVNSGTLSVGGNNGLQNAAVTVNAQRRRLQRHRQQAAIASLAGNSAGSVALQTATGTPAP